MKTGVLNKWWLNLFVLLGLLPCRAILYGAELNSTDSFQQEFSYFEITNTSQKIAKSERKVIANFTLFNTLPMEAKYKDQTIGKTVHYQAQAICFGNNYSEFVEDCGIYNLSSVWLTENVRDFGKILKSAEEKRVKAVIFTSDWEIEADYTDSLKNVKFIMRVSGVEGAELKALSVFPKRAIKGSMEYIICPNCRIMKAPYPLYMFLLFSWVTIIVLYLLCILKWFKYQTIYLHKLLAALPVLRAVQDLLYLIIILSCPWDVFTIVEYFDLIKTSVSTVFETIFIAVLLLISTGFSVTRNLLTKKQLMGILITMGVIYLLNSAFFIAQGIIYMEIIIRVFFLVIYLFVIQNIYKNVIFNIRCLKLQRNLLSDGDLFDITRSLSKKIRMLWIFLVLMISYFLFEIFNALVIPLILDKDASAFLLKSISSLITFLIVISILVLFHPYFYDEYFFLGNVEGLLGAEDPDQEEQREIAEFNNIKLSVKDIQNNEKQILGGVSEERELENLNCQFLILNPIQEKYLQHLRNDDVARTVFNSLNIGEVTDIERSPSTFQEEDSFE